MSQTSTGSPVKTINVSPAEGRRVRDPATMQVIGAGYAVDPTDPYWYRRLSARDVVDDAGCWPDDPPPQASEGATSDDTAAIAKVEGELADAEAQLAGAKSRRAPSPPSSAE